MLHFYLTGHQIELETCSAVPSVPVTIQLFKSEHRKNNFHHLAADRALPRRGGGRQGGRFYWNTEKNNGLKKFEGNYN